MKIIIGKQTIRVIDIAERIYATPEFDWLRQPHESRRSETEWAISKPSGTIMSLGFNMQYGENAYARLEGEVTP